MKALALTSFALLAVLTPQSSTAEEFEVLAATGVRGPSPLEAGQKLAANTRLALEPWGRALIRETEECGLTHVVVGAGEYQLTLASDCSDVADPQVILTLVQQGQVFAARVKETGSGAADALVRGLSNDPCIFLARFSEEGTNRARCPSGYALRGLRCSGPFCDEKDAMCCPYLEGTADDTAKSAGSRWISEEFPSSLRTKKFLIGLECRGSYCDDVMPQPLNSSRLANDGGCDWTAWASEQSWGWVDCGAGRFATGIRCQEEYCGDIGLYCCQAKLK